MIAPQGLAIAVRNLWAKFFPKVSLSEVQLAICVDEWSACRSTVEILKAMASTRAKQRGRIENRLRVENGDLEGSIFAYTTAVLRGRGALPDKPLPDAERRCSPAWNKSLRAADMTISVVDRSK